MDLSDGEKLILTMLCDLHQHLEVKGGIDPELVLAAISGGHHWALEREYTGIFHDEQVDDATLTETYEILEMWTTIERDYLALSAADQKRVGAAVGKDPKFTGFDGNASERHMSVAVFLIDRLALYGNFKGRDMNSHGMPPIDSYRQMLAAFQSTRPNLAAHTSMDADQIIEVLS